MDHKEMFAGGGYNCAESVLAGVTGCSDCLPLASGFGGGIGRSGGTCGAVSGAVMALGLALDVREQGARRSYGDLMELAARFLCEFKSRFGSTLCRELIPFDLNREQDRDAFYSSPDGRDRCLEYVDTAVDLARALLDESREQTA